MHIVHVQLYVRTLDVILDRAQVRPSRIDHHQQCLCCPLQSAPSSKLIGTMQSDQRWKGSEKHPHVSEGAMKDRGSKPLGSKLVADRLPATPLHVRENFWKSRVSTVYTTTGNIQQICCKLYAEAFFFVLF